MEKQNFVRHLGLFFTLALVNLSSFGVNFQQTSRSNSLTFEKLEDSRTYNGFVKNDYDFIFNFGLSQVDSPLVVRNTSKTSQIQPLITSMSSLHYGLGYYLKPWAMIGVTGALVQFKDYADRTYTGFTDTQLRLKFRLYNSDRLALSIVPFLDIPSKSGNMTLDNLPNLRNLNGANFNSLSDDEFGYGGLLTFEYLFDWVQFVVNVGYKSNQGAIIESVRNNGSVQIDYRQQLLTGFGAYVPVTQKWGVNVEWMRKWSTPFFDPDAQAQNELFVGAGFALTKKIHSYAGLGLGNLFSSGEGNDYRITAGLKFAANLRMKERKPIKPIFASDLPEIKNKKCKIKRLFGDTDFAVVRFEKNEFGLEVKDSLINQVINYIADNKDTVSLIKLHGHSSTKPLNNPKASAKLSKLYNQYLSEQRVKAVKEKLISFGVPSQKIKHTAFGQSKPLDLTGTLEAHKVNRRVELEVSVQENFEESCERLAKITKKSDFDIIASTDTSNEFTKALQKRKFQEGFAKIVSKKIKKSARATKVAKVAKVAKVTKVKKVTEAKRTIASINKESSIIEIAKKKKTRNSQKRSIAKTEKKVNDLITKKKVEEIQIAKIDTDAEIKVIKEVKPKRKTPNFDYNIKGLRSCFKKNFVVNYDGNEYSRQPKEMTEYINMISGSKKRIKKIIIEAHSTKKKIDDSRYTLAKSIKRNKELAQERMELVQRSLKYKGINESKLLALNYGASKPVNLNNDEESFNTNRRIEIKAYCR